MHPLSHGCQAPTLGAAAFLQVDPDARATSMQVKILFRAGTRNDPANLEGNEDDGAVTPTTTSG